MNMYMYKLVNDDFLTLIWSFSGPAMHWCSAKGQAKLKWKAWGYKKPSPVIVQIEHEDPERPANSTIAIWVCLKIVYP